MARLSERFPRHVLTVEEVERVLALPDVKTPAGLRDRAMLELLYSSGLRRVEVQALGIGDVERGRGILMIRDGKAGRRRAVPVGDRALAWIDRYLAEVRPVFAPTPDEGVFFLTFRGRPFEAAGLSERVRTYLEAAGLAKVGSFHVFRHTMAAHMLEGGAEVGYIRAMLGAGRSDVAIEKLKEVHARTHPAGRRKGEHPFPV